MVAKRLRVSAGFTLVELLSALTIFGLLMAASFGSVSIAEKVWVVGADRADRNHELRSSIEFARRQFASLVPMTYRLNDRAVPAFEGGRKVLRFVAPAPEAIAGAGMMTITMALVESDATTDVWLDVSPLDPGAPSWPGIEPGQRVILFSELDQAAFAYLGAPYAEDPVQWHAQWPQDAQRFPEAVRLDFENNPGNGPAALPDFLFRIQSERWR